MADEPGIVRRKDSFPQKMGARNWFVARTAVGFVVASVVTTIVFPVNSAAVGYIIALPFAVALAALIQLAAQKAGLRPPKLDLARREPDIRIPEQGSTPVPPSRLTPAGRKPPVVHRRPGGRPPS